MIKKIIAADPEGKHVSGMTQALPELIGGFIYPYAGIVDKNGLQMKMAALFRAILRVETSWSVQCSSHAISIRMA